MREAMCNRADISPIEIERERKTQDEYLFFREIRAVEPVGRFLIIKRGNGSYRGLQRDGEIILPPVYDRVDFISEDIVAIKIRDLYALYDVSESERLTEFEFDTIEPHGKYLVVSSNTKYGLYEIENRRLLIPARYDVINIKREDTEYIWVRNGNIFDFVHRETGRFISMPGAVMAYDTETAMFVMFENRKVALMDERGLNNSGGLRKTVIDKGGYLSLQNITYHTKIIIDVYGNILREY